MANKASAEAVQATRGIKAKKDNVSSLNGEIADIYAKVDGHKVNVKAGKIFYALDRMEEDERNDVLRSLNGLCDAAGWDEVDEDLVDQAEGTVVHLRVGQSSQPVVEDVDEALAGDDFEEASEEELAAQAGRAVTAAKSRARKQLDKPADGFTGDNSDLADAQPQGRA
jgi:hypothetical protein